MGVFASATCVPARDETPLACASPPHAINNKPSNVPVFANVPLPCPLISYISRISLTPLADTPFEDGSFRLTLTFTDAYPNKPPTVRFVSRMFHPNIYNNGELCLDILQNRWSPTYDVAAILTSVQSLLNDPNPSS